MENIRKMSVLVLGNSGAGKSTLIKAISGAEVKTAVGGTCWRFNARLIKSKTIENLKKQVTKIKILGASVKTVNISNNLTEKATSDPVWGSVISIETFGIIGPLIRSFISVVPFTEPEGKLLWAFKVGIENKNKKQTKKIDLTFIITYFFFKNLFKLESESL